MQIPLNFVRISRKEYQEIAILQGHSNTSEKIVINKVLIGCQNFKGAYIDPEFYQHIKAASLKSEK